jgi:peptide alpha-N-acetyltransferase
LLTDLFGLKAEGFRPLANAYLMRGLKKGIPSLFVDLKPLYQDTQKRAILEELVDGYRRSLEEGFLPDENDVVEEPGSDVPTTYLWTLYYLAQHFSHIGQHSRALSLLSSAITHTPTLPELHTLRGRILKRLGDLFGASIAVNEARLLDGQDRFLNTKSAKYKLRAGLIEEASDTLGLFTKVPSVISLCSSLILCFLTTEGCREPWCRPRRDAVSSIPY